jgi:hypothetical protein
MWILLLPMLALIGMWGGRISAAGQEGPQFRSEMTRSADCRDLPAAPGGQDKLAVLRVYLSDQPNPAAQTISFTVADAAIHSPDHGWYGLQKKDLVFEFSPVAGEELLIGEIRVPPGRYDRLHLQLAAAVVEIGDELLPASAPPGELTIDRDLELCPGETEIVVDLGARQSLTYQQKNASCRVQPVLRIADLTRACSSGGGDILAFGNVARVRPL